MTTDQDAAREPQVTTFPHHLGSISPRDLQTLELVEEVVLALPSGGGGGSLLLPDLAGKMSGLPHFPLSSWNWDGSTKLASPRASTL